MAVKGFGVPSGIPRVLAQSAVAVSHTGDTNETALATVAIPAGAMGANGQVEIISVWSYTNSANNKTLRIAFGGTNFYSQTLTTTGAVQAYTRIANRNDVASQIGGPGGNTGWAAAASFVTSTVNTAAAVNIVFNALLASAGETITLESYRIILMPRA